MEKVIITRIAIKDKDKNGNPYRDKNGKPFKRMGIQTDKHGDQWLSALIYNDYDPKLKLKEGDVTEIETEQSGDFVNFRTPSRLELLERRVEALEKNLPQENQINETVGKEIDVSDISF